MKTYSNCPTCGSHLEVAGDVTKNFVPLDAREVEKLTAALEKIATGEGISNPEDCPEVAREALGEAGKPGEPYPRGYCDKCGLPLRWRENFPLLCTCEIGAG